MNRPISLLFTLIFLVIGAGIVWAASMTLTTYYPSPSGNYNTLTANDITIGTTTVGAAELTVVANSPVGTTTQASTSMVDITTNSAGQSLYMSYDGTANAGFIEASATAGFEPLVLQPRGGNVGIGVSPPTTPLEVQGDEGAAENDSQVRIQSNVSGHVAGLHLTDNVTSDSYLTFFPSATASSRYLSLDGGSGTSALLVNGSGNVGIGANPPLQALHIVSSANNGAILAKNTSYNTVSSITPWNGVAYLGTGVYLSGGAWTMSTDTAGDGALFELSVGSGAYWFDTTNSAASWNISNGNQLWNQAGAWTGLIQSVGSDTINGGLAVTGSITATGTITATSDGSFKQNILPLTGTLSKLDQLRGVSFEWNNLSTSLGHKEGEKGIGMIAQELQKVYPELVVRAPIGAGKKEYLSIDYMKFTAVLLQSIKEQQKEIEELQNKVKMLEKQK